MAVRGKRAGPGVQSGAGTAPPWPGRCGADSSDCDRADCASGADAAPVARLAADQRQRPTLHSVQCSMSMPAVRRMKSATA